MDTVAAELALLFVGTWILAAVLSYWYMWRLSPEEK